MVSATVLVGGSYVTFSFVVPDAALRAGANLEGVALALPALIISAEAAAARRKAAG